MSQTKAQLISDLVQALNFTGTASAPANGLFLSAANTLQLSTASTPRLTINSDGHVDVVGNLDVGAGIDVTGHATVSQSLTVTGTTSLGETVNITGNDPNITFVDSNNNPDFKIFGNGGTLNFVDSTSSANRLVINSDGHVDIPGNLDCGAGIDVTGNITGTGDLTLASGGANRLQMTSTGGGAMVIKNPTAASLSFGTNNQNSELHIANGGKVGIGTSSPEETLDLGNATQMNLKIGGRGYIGQAYSTAATIIGHSVKAKTTGTTSGGMIVTETNSGGGAPSALRMQSGNIEFHTAASGTQDADFNSNERMRIDSTGRVLIGTTTPDPFGNRQLTVASSSSAHLEIRSGTSASGIIVFTDGTSGGTDSFKAQIKYNQASDFMSFSTNGANERLRIDSIGNVMMGTTTASGALTVVSTKNAESGRSNASNYHLHLRNNENDNGEAIGISFGITSSSTGVGASILHERDSSGSQGSLQFYTNGDGSNVAERMRIDSSGNIGIGTTSPSANLHLKDGSGNTEIKLQGGASTANDVIAFLNSAGSTRGNITYDTDNDFVLFNVNTSERMRITNGGDLVLNSTSARVYNGHTPKLSIQGTNFSQSTLAITSNSNGTDGAYLFFVKQRSGSVGGSTAPSNGDLVGQFRYLAGDGTDTQSEVANISVNIDGTPGSNDTPGRITFATTNDGGNASTERMRITNAGHVHIGNGHGNANHRINGNGFTQGQTFLVVSAYSSSAQDTAIFFGVDSAGGNTASCGLKLGRNSSNLRSLNAGGTLNASGSDYAEYMTKSSDFTLAKGAICGINAEGKLTNKFSESISFVVKSTDPSYVGGDTWGSEDILGKKPKDKSSELPAYEEKMEAARKMVDRIAFSGQVPVNVTGTTPGQHIIPTLGTDDSITGVAKAEASLSMAEYISSVGKVIALESDGRARIIVKVA